MKDIYEIAAASDALMVARGDLWAELRNPWSLPGVSKETPNTIAYFLDTIGNL